MKTSDRSANELEEAQKDLICRARGGDPDARDRLVRLFVQPLRRYLRRRVGARLTRSLATCDLEQEIFVQGLGALQHLSEGATLRDFQALLFQHARWQVFKKADRERAFCGESAVELPLCDAVPARSSKGSGEDGWGQVTLHDEVAWLKALIGRLPLESRRVVRLRLSGLSFAAIAEELRITEDTARKRHLRASQALRELAEGRLARDRIGTARA